MATTFYGTGTHRLVHKSKDFGTGKVITAYIWNPSLDKSALQTFTEVSDGLYYLDYNFIVLGTHFGKFYEDDSAVTEGVFRINLTSEADDGSTIVGLPLATTMADDDVIPFTDISDTTEEPTGKTKKITKSNLIASGVSYGDLVSKVISGGAIDLTDSQHFVALTGEGDTTDALTAITKTGGGNLKVGFVVLLTGKAGLSYTIALANAGNFKLQFLFNISNEYDNISLIHRGSGIFQEKGGRINV